jgi:O-methyltransferase
MMDYLDLLKKTLTGYLYSESAWRPIEPKSLLRRLIVQILARRSLILVYDSGFSGEKRECGMDWPGIAYTMVGLRRLDNLRDAIDTIERENIPGDLLEAGAWRGGASIFMRACLKLHGSTRRLWVADSFQGLPPPSRVEDAPYDLSGVQYLAVSLDDVKRNFERFEMLDDQVQFLQGWFSDTLPKAPIGRLALLRLDGDLYQSTMDVLNALYHKVSPGGFLIVDDYHSWEPCRQAITAFRAAHGITAPIHDIDWTGVYWRVVE